MYCIHCGYRLHPGAAFCARCGRKYPAPVQHMDIKPVFRKTPGVAEFGEFAPATYVPAAPAANGWLEADELPGLRREGAIAGFIVAAATGFVGLMAMAGFDIFGVGPWSLIDAAIFALLGFGTLKNNRLAAAAAFTLFLAETITVFAAAGQSGTTVGIAGIIIRMLLVRSFYRGVKGVLSSHPGRFSLQAAAGAHILLRPLYLLTAGLSLAGIAAGIALSSLAAL
ncbi:MAG TPA: zinc ribbon domain-containing protein [Candidatus Saccharimonadia bacterium]|nr:zinc ribbon domain-containing protein [Candidatus Saccharimonadia bacterium]